MSVPDQTQTIDEFGSAQPLSTADPISPDQGLDQIREYLSRGGHVPEARALATELAERWPDNERVQHWARVLAPPVVVPTPEAHRTADPREREHEWLKQHRQEHPGCWLAVHEDRLIAADPNLDFVIAEARRELGGDGAVIHWQPQRAKGQ